MTSKVFFGMLSMLALVACDSTPEKQPTPQQRAEIEQARSEMIASECALYEEAKARDPNVNLPAQCKQ